MLIDECRWLRFGDARCGKATAFLIGKGGGALKGRYKLDYLIRFAAGGAVVSLFAILGDLLRPKSFAGLFGAAPSVALATLALAFWKEGHGYVALEGRSMILGGLALTAYTFAVCQAIIRGRTSAFYSALGMIPIWFIVASVFKWTLLG